MKVSKTLDKNVLKKLVHAKGSLMDTTFLLGIGEHCALKNIYMKSIVEAIEAIDDAIENKVRFPNK